MKLILLLPVPVQLFIFCFIQSGIITVNFRAVAQANYVATFVTDMLLFMNGFYIVKRIVDAKTVAAQIGYAFGGSCGSILAIYLSKVWFGQ